MDGDAPARAGMYQLWEMRAGAPVLVGTYAEKGEAQRVLRRTPGTAIAVGGRVMETRVDVGAKQKRAFTEAVAAWRPGDAVATPTPPPPLVLAPTASADDAEDDEDEAPAAAAAPTPAIALTPPKASPSPGRCAAKGCNDPVQPWAESTDPAMREACKRHRERLVTWRYQERRAGHDPTTAEIRARLVNGPSTAPRRASVAAAHAPDAKPTAPTSPTCCAPGCGAPARFNFPAGHVYRKAEEDVPLCWPHRGAVGSALQAAFAGFAPPTPSFPPDLRYEVAEDDKPDAIERGVKALRIALSNFDDCGGLAAVETRLREMASLTPADRDELAELRAIAARVGGRAKLEQLVAAVEATR